LIFVVLLCEALIVLYFQRLLELSPWLVWPLFTVSAIFEFLSVLFLYSQVVEYFRTAVKLNVVAHSLASINYNDCLSKIDKGKTQ